jgi:YVTN family beta-propeller protein
VGPGPLRGFHFESTPLGIQYGDPTWFAYDGAVRSFYIAQNNSTVSVVPAGSIGLVAAMIPVGSAPFGVAYDSGKGRVFVANSGSNNLSVISDTTNRTVASVTVGNTPYGVAFDNASDRLFVANGGSGTVTVVNASTLTVLANVTVGSDPVGVAYDPVSGDIFVANMGSADVSVISAASLTVVATAAAGIAPYGVAIDNATGEAYVSDLQSGDVTVLDASGSSTVTTLAVGGGPEGLTYDWRNQSIWVADSGAFVVVINASQNQIVQDLFFDPMGAAYDGDDGNVCFTNAANATFQCVTWQWGRYYSELANLTFTESGLPPGTEWAVSVSGFFGTDVQISSNTSTLVFQVFYAFGEEFTVVPLSGWSATPSSGSTPYTAGAGSFNITFTRTPGNYTITFLETGLVFNPWFWQYWGVNFSGAETYSPGPPVVVAATNGTYSYVGYPIRGYVTPTLARVTVDGTDVVVVVDYSPTFAYAVSFSESGLPSGTEWEVILDGAPAESATTSIALAEPNGTYGYSIGAIAGYIAGPQSGSVSVAGARTSAEINFSRISPGTFPVLFTEAGLPAATNWSVALNGSIQSSAGNEIVFLEPNGTYPFVIGGVPDWTTASFSGSVIVTGANVSESVNWTEVAFAVVLEESGLPTGTEWSGSIDGVTEQSSTANLTFEEPNGTHAFVVGLAPGFTSTPESGLVQVAGEPVMFALSFRLTLYSVAFSEYGLPSGTVWAVKLNGTEEILGGESIVFSEPNGSYSFLVSSPLGYAASPWNGTVTVDGMGTDQTVTFSPEVLVLTASFTWSVDSESCLTNGNVVNSITLDAEAGGGTPPYNYTWALPTGPATGPVTNTTLTYLANNTITLTVADAVGDRASHSAAPALLLPPCPPPPFEPPIGLTSSGSSDAVIAIAIVAVGVTAAAAAVLVFVYRKPET